MLKFNKNSGLSFVIGDERWFGIYPPLISSLISSSKPKSNLNW